MENRKIKKDKKNHGWIKRQRQLQIRCSVILKKKYINQEKITITVIINNHISFVARRQNRYE